MSCVAISRDSKLIASGSWSGSIIRLWYADTCQLVCTFQGHERGIHSLDFKGQSTLVSGGIGGTIKVWALRDEEAPALLHTLRRCTSDVLAVKVSPDGMKIASGSDGGTVMIGSVQSGEQLLKLYDSDPVWCVAWSSDSRLVASGTRGHNVCVWDAAEGTEVIELLESHDGGVSSVVLNTTTTLLFSAGYDRTIIIWDLDIAGRNATVRRRLYGHFGALHSISLCPDERFIVQWQP